MNITTVAIRMNVAWRINIELAFGTCKGSVWLEDTIDSSILEF